MKRWLNIGVEGGAIWPTKETTIKFDGHEIVLKPTTNDYSASVHAELSELNLVEAYTLINRFLSILSWCDDQAMEDFVGWSGGPLPADVPRKAVGVGSSIDFPFYRDLEADPKARLALALYREAKTVNSIPYEFLGYFKIVNLLYKTGENQKQFIKDNLENLKDTAAINRVEELKSLGEDVPNFLYESGRCAIAHAYSQPILDPDDIKEVRRLSLDLSIIKEMAEIIIEDILGVSRSILG
jgi:hypothetical protein